MSDAQLPLQRRPDLLRARLRALPQSPGVYLMRDQAARVIYVGKAASLRDRVRSYFVKGQVIEKVADMVPRIFDFEYIACASEKEAMVLENNLIKHHRPRFNVRLRDDKTYLYLRLPVADPTGRPTYVRRPAEDGGRYFGPFTDAKGLRSTLRSLRRVFPYRNCSDAIYRRGRVCLDYHLGICAGPCEGRISPEEHAQLLANVGMFMEGRTTDLVRDLRRRMQEASDAERFEAAATQRDRLRSIERLSQEQHAASSGRDDHDVVAVAAGAGGGLARVFRVRRGRLLGGETYALDGTDLEAEPEVLASFLAQHYGAATDIPPEVLVAMTPADAPLLASWLQERRGGRVEVRVPVRGEKKRLLEQVIANAGEALHQQAINRDFDQDRTRNLLDDLARRLNLSGPPQRIECYDISNIQGTSAVGSMVVFEEGRPRTSDYRRFGIREVDGSDDFAMLREVLRRRFARFRGGARLVEDTSFSALPDLVLIDGGRGQLSAAVTAMAELDVRLPTFGLAKRYEELFQPGSSEPIRLPRDSEALFLLQRVRDEAHRFAVTYHRKVRGDKALTSELERIEGVGPVVRRALIKRFGSVAGVREATVEQLLEVPRVNRTLALRIRETL